MYYSFRNDYSEGAHELVMEALLRSNREQTVGYGKDGYCESARELIKKEACCETAQVYFIPGGTQTNLLVISSLLRPFEAVIAAETGHINVHETGAIEATGHKVLTISSNDGKLTPRGIKAVLDFHTDEHMVRPRMVYISNSTEMGTIYKKEELEVLAQFCKENGLYLYLDGARLGAAICARDNNLSLKDIARLTDCFYIGGTKNGALFGEALVLVHSRVQKDFSYMVKQKGAMLAKGRLLGIQFLTLFQDGLYFRLADHGNRMGQKLKEGIRALGYELLADSTTNQQFPLFPAELTEFLSGKYDYEEWGNFKDKKCIRLVTSWATDEAAVDQFLRDLKNFQENATLNC